MSQDPNSTDSLTLEEQLSAYLDGELDDEAVREVERMLASDPKVRETLQRLERTWEILDKLDEAEVGEHFTQSTLKMVALAVEDDVQKQLQEAPKRRRRQWLVGGAGVTAAAAAGFVTVALLWPNPNKELLRDLPVLENLDQYRQIEDFDFLEGLYKEGLFVGEDEDGQ
jgi:anti-sigma factor RsiW